MNGPYIPYRRVSDASNNALVVKAQRGYIGYVSALNINAAVRYLHVFDQPDTPQPTLDTPVLTLPIPAAGQALLSIGDGMQFLRGIAIMITTTNGPTPASGPVAANEITVNIGWA